MLRQRSITIYVILLLLLTAAVPGCRDVPRSAKPLPVQPEKRLLAVHDGFRIYQENDSLLLVNNDRLQRLHIGETGLKAVSWLSSKPMGQNPLIDRSIMSGVILAGAADHYIVQLQPTAQLLISHPEPVEKQGSFIHIEKENNRLYLFEDGWLVKSYSVSTGKMPWYTPEGTFRIVNKMPYPKGRDPEAPMGTRWMGLAVPVDLDQRGNKWNGGPDPRSPVGQKFGIHGTNDESTIGTHASGGCIRMYNQSVNELYDLVDIGTPVKIVP